MTLTRFKQIIAKHQDELAALGKDNPRIPQNVTLRELSLYLLFLDENSGQPFATICQIANDECPIKVGKPKPGTSYCTITPQFSDPRKWANLTGRDPATHQTAVQAIKKNNQRMIDQFLIGQLGAEITDQAGARAILDDFLNAYLLEDGIRFVTTNLAEANVYFWLALQAEEEPEPISLALTKFFRFLSQAGIVNKPSANRVAEYLQATIDIAVGKNDLAYDDFSMPFADDLEYLSDNYDLFQQAIRAGNLPADFQKVLDGAVERSKQKKAATVKHLTNPAHVNKSYDIRVQLQGFKPAMLRELHINGDRTIAELQEVIIDSFQGELAHLYDLTSKATGEIYTLPEFIDEDFPPDGTVIDARKATVSLLDEGDRLVLTYDYGDDWQFTVKVRQIFSKIGNYPPMITAACGYGIIEGIGGPGALTEYYRAYQRGQVDPDMKEWLGGELINLDLVDLIQLNDEIRQLFY